MSFRKNINNLALFVLLSSTTSSALAELPLYYAVAKTNLKAGTVLSSGNIAVTRAIVATAPRGSMWLKSPDQAYGYKVYHDCAKGNPLSTSDLKGDDRGSMTPLKSDPMWIQYAKSSHACMERNDLATAARYQSGALAELNKLVKEKKQVDHLGDEIWLSLLIEECIRTGEKTTAIPSPSDVANLKDFAGVKRALDVMESDTRRSNANKLSVNEQFYKPLSKLLPPTSVFLKSLTSSLSDQKAILAKRH
jgi:SAF domain